MREIRKSGSARRRICMTSQRKFCTGNCWHVQLATGTGLVVTLALKLPECKIAGRIEREHDVASRGVAGRQRKSNRSEGYHGGMTEPEGPIASPVFPGAACEEGCTG